MKVLIKRLFKDYLVVFLYFILIEMFFKGLILVVSGNELLRMAHSMWILISSTALVYYATYSMFQFLYTRERYFYYTIKFSRLYILLVLSTMLLLGNIVYYVIYSFSFSYELIQKAISLLSYFSVVIALLYIFRTLKNKKLGKYLVTLCIITIIATYVCSFCYIFRDELGLFMIGVTSYENAKNIYTLIIPLTLINSSDSYNSLARYTICVNLMCTLLSIVSYKSISKKKINW